MSLIFAKPLSKGAMPVLLATLLAGSLLLAHPELDQQIASTTALIEIDPDDPQLYLQRGELHRIHEDWPAAQADFRHARKLRPDLAVVDFLVGKLKLEAGHPKQALASLDRFLVQEPGHARARITRARTLVVLGKPLAAAGEYTRALGCFGERDRPEPAHYLERARALADAGDEHLGAAVAGLDEGLARLGKPVTLQLFAIELEIGRGHHDAALARLDEIASRANRKESWLLRRGEILEAAGRNDQARAAYTDALAAVGLLSAGRRGTRAVSRIRTQAEEALARLDTPETDPVPGPSD